jgi:hypothetical protein
LRRKGSTNFLFPWTVPRSDTNEEALWIQFLPCFRSVRDGTVKEDPFICKVLDTPSKTSDALANASHFLFKKLIVHEKK